MVAGWPACGHGSGTADFSAIGTFDTVWLRLCSEVAVDAPETMDNFGVGRCSDTAISFFGRIQV